MSRYATKKWKFSVAHDDTTPSVMKGETFLTLIGDEDTSTESDDQKEDVQ